MDMTNVDLTADRAQERFTSHQFMSLEPVAGPSGSVLHIPSDMSIWPPTMLFEAIYASTVAYHFGFAGTDILGKWGDVFYHGGPMQAADTRDKHQCNQAN